MSDMEATVARLTDERDRAREECGYEKAMRAHQREEMMQHFRKRREAEATVARVEAVCGSLVGHLTISQSESGTQPLAGEWVRLDDLRAALHPEEAPDA